MLTADFLKELDAFIIEHSSVAFVASESIMEKQSFVETEELVEIEELHFSASLEEFIEVNRKPKFQEVLFQFIDISGETDAAIYRRAGIDRKLFSKIRSNPDYHPSKNTVIALSFALKLNKENTDELLNAAGYSLSESDISDLIIQFFLKKNIHDLYQVNEALDHYNQKVLL